MPCKIAIYISDLNKFGCIPKVIPIADPCFCYSTGGKRNGSVLVSCREQLYKRNYYLSEKQISEALTEGHAVLTLCREDAPRLFLNAYNISKEKPGCVSVAEYISRDNGEHWSICDPDISYFKLKFANAVESILNEQAKNYRLKIK